MQFDSTAIIIALISLILSGFFSGMEMAFVTSNKVRVNIDVRKGGLTSRMINFFYRHSDMVISTLLVGNNVVLVVYGMEMAKILEPVICMISPNEAFVLVCQTLISTVVILLAGEFLPKTLFRNNPNSSLRTFALPLYLIYYLLYPISWFSSFISRMLMRLCGIKVANVRLKGFTVGELDAYIQENIERHSDDSEEVEREVRIFQNALDFSDTHLRDCMMPRNEIVAVNIEGTTRDMLVERFSESGLSKIVVFRDDIDNVVGYIHVSELFNPEIDWHERIKPVLFAPETRLANKMMRELLSQKKSMAIVVDEFGGTAGLVTLEDLVEEIFGDIEDEHDRNRRLVRKVSEGVYDISGRIEVEQLRENYHIDIPESEEYQTLAGYLLFNLEEIPETGEMLEIDGNKFTILKTSASKIELVRLTLPAAGK